MYRVAARGLWCGTLLAPQPDSVETQSDKWNRVKKVFFIDEFGTMTPQLNTMIQTTVMTSMFGGFYGGYIGAREAYFRFIETNQATKFTDHFEAKKKLQEKTTLGFARGALRWAPRLAAFSCCYISYVTLMAAYRGNSSVWDYTVAGLFSGAVYRIHMGVRAMVAAGTLGGMMGMFAGGVTDLLFRLTGSSLDDLQNYTTQVTSLRDQQYQQAAQRYNNPDREHILDHHDVLVHTSLPASPPTKHDPGDLPPRPAVPAGCPEVQQP